MLGAILWDVDGTLAETERDGHRVAFNQAFETLGVPWRWNVQRYGELLAVTGGRERLLFDMQTQPLAPPHAAERESLAQRLHALKNQRYAQIVASGALPLRPGVRELMADCAHAQVRMAVVTTTSRVNVEALLGAHLGARWQLNFAVVVTAQEAPQKKPDPQAYHLALQRLQLPASAVLAIEDSPAGVKAARAADVPVIVTRSCYFPEHPVPGALAVGPSLGQTAGWQPAVTVGARGVPERVDLGQLQRWLEQVPP